MSGFGGANKIGFGLGVGGGIPTFFKKEIIRGEEGFGILE